MGKKKKNASAMPNSFSDMGAPNVVSQQTAVTQSQAQTQYQPQPQPQLQQIIVQQQTMVNIPMTIVPTHEYQELLRTNKELKDQVMILEGNNGVLRITMDQKDGVIDALRKENELLRLKIVELEGKLGSVEKKLDCAMNRIDELEARDSPITVREAMRVLESYICLAIVGSKSKMKMGKLYNLTNINGEASLKSKKLEVMTELGIEEKHLNMLAYLKDEGDNSAHDKRPVYTRIEWNTVIIDAEDDSEEEKNVKLKLLHCLEHYIPPPTTGGWPLIGALEKKGKSVSAATSLDDAT